jgi:hypothetical protein
VAKDLHSKPSEIKHAAEFEWHQGFSTLGGSTLTTVIRKQEISPRRIAYMRHSLLRNGMVERPLLKPRPIKKRSEKIHIEWKRTNAVKSSFAHQFVSVIKVGDLQENSFYQIAIDDKQTFAYREARSEQRQISWNSPTI